MGGRPYWHGACISIQAMYIDPLSGSVILQVLAAGVLSFVFTMKRSWRWLTGRFQALVGSLRRR